MKKKIQLLAILFTITLSSYGQIYLDPNAPIEDRVNDLLSQMTLPEKIGQMTQAERGSVEASGLFDIQQYFLGSVLSGGGSVPNPNTPESWVAMYNNMQSKALSTRLGIPILYGVDAVHGHNNLKDAVIFPHNIGLGCTRNPDLVQECARITALELRASGPHWTFSPCVAVPQNEFWGRTYEGFGESPYLVDSMGKAAVLGFQSDSLGAENCVLACAKHFIGDGGTQNGIDQGNTLISEAVLREIHLPPYISAVNEGVGSVMISYNSWNGVKCHGNAQLITDMLKEELGFEGFVVSDWNGINQVNGDFKQAIKTAINAGIDMAMQPNNYIEFINLLTQLVNEGQVSTERIDDAVARILDIKIRLGLFENPYAGLDLVDTVGCAFHREVARQAVRESLVLLKNDNILPLPKQNAEILLAGSKAYDIGVMCGGWTISWQGSTGDITEGTTIYHGIQQAIGSQNLIYTNNPEVIPEADYAVVVVGENPYAEGAGDLYGNVSGFGLNNADKQMIQAVKNANIPMVVVLLSGRPLDIRNELEDANAFIAAWLPGSEGGSGIADILFGDYQPTGKLSHTWPETYGDVPINIIDNYPGHNALFPYGYSDSFTIGVDENTASEYKIQVFPNPVEDNLFIKSVAGEMLTINIIDITGRVILQEHRQSDETIRINVVDFNPGVYIVTVSGEGFATKEKFIKN